MIPNNWIGFLFFLLLVIPGLIYELTARSRRIPWKESVFTEISRIVLSSIGFTFIGLLFTLLLWIIVPWLHLDYRSLVLNRTYLVDHLPQVLILLLVSTAVASLSAWQWDRSRKYLEKIGGRQPKIPNTDEQSAKLVPNAAWLTAFREMAPDNRNPFVRISMKDGSHWLGWVAHYTAKDDEPSRSIILAGPLAFRKPNGTTTETLAKEWTRVVLESDSISSIAIQYLVRPTNSAETDVIP